MLLKIIQFLKIHMKILKIIKEKCENREKNIKIKFNFTKLIINYI